MRIHLFLVTGLSLAFLAVPAQATLTQVTVYPGGAQLTDERSVELKKGLNILPMGTLGQGVSADSLRVITPPGVRVIDRVLQVAHTPAEPHTARDALQAQLQQAKDKLQAFDDRLSLISRREMFLEKIENSSTAPNSSDNYTFPSPTQWEGLITFLYDKRQASQKERRSLLAERLLALKELESLQRQLNELEGSPTLYQQKLTLHLEALKDQKATLTLAYFDPNASWRPGYQVAVDPDTQAVQLTYGAHVRQRTATAWERVALTLSTARPQLGGTPPELAPWWLSEAQPVAPMVARQAHLAGAVMAKMALAEAADASSDSFQAVQLEDRLTFAEYKLPGSATVPADNEEHRFVVAEVPLQGQLHYRIVPELSSQAYLQAQVTNSSGFTFLPGTSQLYSAGNFVGQASLDLIHPAESFELNLGVDPALKIERKQLSRKVDLTAFDSQKVTYTYHIELTNNKKSAQKIRLVERLPLSQHEKIKVQLLQPKRAKDIDPEGKLTWELTLPPGRKEVIELSYSIEHPRKMQLQGL